jgi:hypothetical protein
MRATKAIIAALAGGMLAAGCDNNVASGPTGLEPSEAAAFDRGAGPIVTGAGHVLRNLGAGPELTTFSYNAVRQGTGDVSGHFVYHFRAAEFSMIGRVTCATTTGNRAWIGGVIESVASDDPADQSFVGTDVWWLVEDNGDGTNDSADRTTSLLLTLPTTTITAASWCRDKPVNPAIPLRAIAGGNIVIH